MFMEGRFRNPKSEISIPTDRPDSIHCALVPDEYEIPHFAFPSQAQDWLIRDDSIIEEKRGIPITRQRERDLPLNPHSHH
jgi:hypothetical protein